MNKTEMKKDIDKRLGGKMFVTRNKLVEKTGFGTAFIETLVKDLEFIEVGNSRKYYTGDVISKLVGLATR